jgi:hypothetical protein
MVSHVGGDTRAHGGLLLLETVHYICLGAQTENIRM